MAEVVTGDVSTVHNEIERHFKLASIFYELDKLMPDAKIFTAANLAQIHNDSASRLNRAVRNEAEGKKIATV